MVVVWFVSSELSGIFILFIRPYHLTVARPGICASGSKILVREKNKVGRVFQPLSQPLLLVIALVDIYICCALAVCSETHRLL